MSIPKRFAAVPQNIWALICVGIFVITALSAYLFYQDARLLENRIVSRQQNLGNMLRLRNLYEAKKKSFETNGAKTANDKPISLALVEELVAKTVVGGRLTSLQPVMEKQDKKSHGIAVEVKIAGIPLGEVVSFVKTAEDVGLQVFRLRLVLSASSSNTLDMQIMLVGRRSHG
jgi:hypothetical protein